ncbi:MAG: MFS transporter [Bacteroidota bacterium]|nr:MFS transporter [Bacteroidota bacterium]MDP4190529.1 MFS transporter [Bacteroidota bacterium]MDP4193668.1 MFS transporter [Bacteroidota bacterium]
MEQTKNSGKYRWTVVALLFFATTINYIDRQVLGLLAPVLEKQIGWTELEYSYIVTAFQIAYAIGLLSVGNLIDKFGTKLGYAVSIVVWSIAAMGHALAKSVFGFGFARFTLGFGESGNFPAAIKATAEWFPKKERALATGIFNSGANIGAVFAPLAVPWLTLTFGWQSAFIVTGAIGFLWIIFWLLIYERPEKHKSVTKAELEYILSDPEVDEPGEKIPWSHLLKYRQTWAFVIAKFMTDPVWWFYLFWLPKFLNKEYGLDLAHLGLPLIVIYTMTSVGSIGGGWLSSFFIGKGWEVNKARKVVMLICALAIVPIIFAAHASNLWLAVLLIGLAAAAHQGWSANVFTTSSDMFPKKAIGSIVGLGGMAGAVGGSLFASLAGLVLQLTHNYFALFVISGTAYLAALLIFTLLVPKIEPIGEIKLAKKELVEEKI